MIGIAASGAALVLILAACSKGADTSTSSTTTTTNDNAMASPAAMASTGAANGAAASDGGKIFATNCSSCHQAQGQGMPGAFPPLAGNPVVTGDPKHLIHIVKYGLNGKIAVAGHDYNGQMPAWKTTLSDGDIAAVLTYIRSSWGNSASAISAGDVTAVAQ